MLKGANQRTVVNEIRLLQIALECPEALFSISLRIELIQLTANESALRDRTNRREIEVQLSSLTCSVFGSVLAW